jgi:hypothetical protein
LRRTASRQSAGMVPAPSVTKGAVMQVYGADTWGWRGWFAIHTWFAPKRTGESNYKVYDVVGWRGYSCHPVMRITQDIPDRYWFGEKPRLIKEHRGRGDESQHTAPRGAHRHCPLIHKVVSRIYASSDGATSQMPSTTYTTFHIH